MGWSSLGPFAPRLHYEVGQRMNRVWILRSLSVLLAALAFVGATEAVFRCFVQASDIPYWAPDAQLGYRHEARREGLFVAAGHRARFRLNNRGWNSPRDYARLRRPGVVRIAVVGDSYVEALQVDVERSLGPELERA